MNEERKCIVCGSPLTERQKSFCSRKCCRKSSEMKRREECRSVRKESKKEHKKPKVSFYTIIRGMEKTGLSYGEYVARFVKEET